MTDRQEIGVVIGLLRGSYDDNDIVYEVIEQIDDFILEYIDREDIVTDAIDSATEDETKEMFDNLDHPDYFKIETTRLDTQRMLEYLVKHLNDVSLEDLETIINNKK